MDYLNFNVFLLYVNGFSMKSMASIEKQIFVTSFCLCDLGVMILCGHAMSVFFFLSRSLRIWLNVFSFKGCFSNQVCRMGFDFFFLARSLRGCLHKRIWFDCVYLGIVIKVFLCNATDIMSCPCVTFIIFLLQQGIPPWWAQDVVLYWN